MTTLAQARATINATRCAPAPEPTLWQEHGFALPGSTVLAIVAAVAVLSLLLA